MYPLAHAKPETLKPITAKFSTTFSKLYPVVEEGRTHSTSQPVTVYVPPAAPHTVTPGLPVYPLAHARPETLKPSIVKVPVTLSKSYPVVEGRVHSALQPITVYSPPAASQVEAPGCP